jgi:hypothetical protein
VTYFVLCGTGFSLWGFYRRGKFKTHKLKPVLLKTSAIGSVPGDWSRK